MILYFKKKKSKHSSAPHHELNLILFFLTGIYDLYIDFPQQKLTIIGWADPEKIMKAIKKTRKIATICSHTEQPTEPPLQEEPAPEDNGQPQQPPPHEAAQPNHPPLTEAPSPEQAPPVEPPQDQPPPENPTPPPPEPQPSPIAADTNNAGHHPVQPSSSSSSGPKDVGEVHVIYHHPPDYGYRHGYGYGYGYGHGHGHCYNGYWNKYHNGQGHPPQEAPAPVPAPVPVPPSPVYVTHSYNTYKPSPYVTEYEYIRSPPSQTHFHNRIERYNEDQNQYYYNVNSGNNNGNITSIFSDENPNACRIV